MAKQKQVVFDADEASIACEEPERCREAACRATRFRPSLRLALGAVTCVLGVTAPPISAQGAGPPAIELRGVENLGMGTSPSKAAMAKAGADLLALYAEYQAHLQQTSGQGAVAPAFRSRNSIAPIAGGSVVIDAAASGEPGALAADPTRKHRGSFRFQAIELQVLDTRGANQGLA
jgi:hypothetical protein